MNETEKINLYVSSRMLRPSGPIVLPFIIKNKVPRPLLRIEFFSMGISCMSLAVWLGEERECSATVVGLDSVLIKSFFETSFSFSHVL